jgi:hypothetical protein
LHPKPVGFGQVGPKPGFAQQKSTALVMMDDAYLS